MREKKTHIMVTREKSVEYQNLNWFLISKLLFENFDSYNLLINWNFFSTFKIYFLTSLRKQV